MNYSIFDVSTGQILKVVYCSLDQLHLQYSIETQDYLEGSLADNLFYVSNGEPVSMPTQPTPNHIFNWTTKEWYDPRTLADLKDLATQRINKAWDLASQSGFSYQDKLFATDASSRSDIDGINGYVALYDNFPQGWVGAWKSRDGSYLPIPTVADWKAFYSAMVTAGLSNFTKAQQLKAQISQATTLEQLELIQW
jgi:Domain of unknown function (DUF4376)